MSLVSRPQVQSLVLAIAASVALSACAETISFNRDRAPSRSVNGFDAKAVAWSKKPGTNRIAGTAELTAQGKTRTCAGLEVRLVPDARYTRERVALLYGTATEGFVDADRARRVQERPGAVVEPAYARSHKVATCDAKGRFSFAQLADGTYYVLAPVVWRKANAQTTDGGFLMQRVNVKGGETKRLHMTPPTRVSGR
jgi:hypothetical protein